MPHKRPNFQRITFTDDPPKVIEPPKPEEPKAVVEEPYFQQRTVRFDFPKSPTLEETTSRPTTGRPTTGRSTTGRPKTEEAEKPFYEPKLLFANPPKTAEEEELIRNDDGYYSLRKNYQVDILELTYGLIFYSNKFLQINRELNQAQNTQKRV